MAVQKEIRKTYGDVAVAEAVRLGELVESPMGRSRVFQRKAIAIWLAKHTDVKAIPQKDEETLKRESRARHSAAIRSSWIKRKAMKEAA